MGSKNCRPFDTIWQSNLTTALNLLRSAVSNWALHGVESLPVDVVLAVLVEALTGCSLKKIPPPSEWPVEFDSLEDTCAGYRRDLAPDDLAEVTRELHTCLTTAAHDWLAGALEDPPTELVFLDLVAILFRHRLVHRPPPRRVE